MAPGQTGEIEVSVKSEGLAAVNKSVTVTTNDPQNRQVVLILTAAVQPEFILSERTINFGNVPLGKEAGRDIVVTISAEKPVKLVGATSTDTSFTARLDPVDGTNGKKFRLTGVMKADAKEGYHFGVLVIKTNSLYTPELKIPVRGMVVAPQKD